MKVIMLKDVAKIGRKGEIREVADGHAINFLIPRKMAEKATTEKMRELEAEQKTKKAVHEHHAEQVGKAIESLSGQTIKITAKVNEKGHLYRELKPKDIVFAVKEQTGLDIPEECLKGNTHIKEAGKTKVHLDGGGKKGEFEIEI